MGILYRITSPSGKQYIGITSGDLRSRWTSHVSLALANDTRRRTALGAAIRKYSRWAFKLETLAIIENSEMSAVETRAIQAFGTKMPNGYNLTDGGEGFIGLKRTPAHNKKIGDAQRGRKRPEYARLMTGRKRTPEQCARLSAALKGKTLGRKFSSAHCAAISRGQVEAHHRRIQKREQQEAGV